MSEPKRWHQYVGVQAALIGALGLIIVAGMNICYNRSRLVQNNEQYKTEIDNLKQNLSNKDFEIQRLETQLAPFKTVALKNTQVQNKKDYKN